MTEYIDEIKRQFIEVYGFPPIPGKPGCSRPPDGDYPMTIEGKIDTVRIREGAISCCNFEKENGV